MRRTSAGAPLAAVLAAAILVLAGWGQRAALVARSAPPSAALRSSVRVLSQTPDEVVLEFTLSSAPGASSGPPPVGPEPRATELEQVEYAGPGGNCGSAVGRVWTATASAPAAFSVLVRVPDTGIIVAEARPTWDSRGDGAAFGVSDPAVFRDLRVVRVTFRPFADQDHPEDPVTDLTLVLRRAPSPGANEKRHRHPVLSPAFDRLYRDKILNYLPDKEPGRGRHVGLGPKEGSVLGRVDGARYLVITPDRYVGAVRPLVEWKSEKGVLTKVAPLSETGSSAAGIRSYIQSAYYGWSIPPEFVLLVGDVVSIPAPGAPLATDNYYAAIEGGDCLADVIVGRFPAADAMEVRGMVAKTLAYERPWTLGGTEWLTTGALLVRDDYDPSDAVYYGDTWFIHGLMEDAGFVPIDTLFARNGVSEDDVYASLSAGRAFVNFRGVSAEFWIPPFMIMPWSVENGWRTPIVVSATCLTGALDEAWAMGLSWMRHGTETDPGGCVAFFGTATSGTGLPLTMKRGLVDRSFFASAFGDGRTVGEACVAAKLALYEETSDQGEYEGWNLQGDPELPVWTGEPQVLTVEHDRAVSVGPGELSLLVAIGGEPVAGATAAVSRAPDVYALSETGADGRALLVFETSAPCTLFLSVTSKNARPYSGDVLVVPVGPYVDLHSFSWSDEGGDGDGFVDPGEALEAAVALVNLGDESASSVEAVLRVDDPLVSLPESLAFFGEIPPDSVALGDRPYSMRVSEDWPVGHALRLSLSITHDDTTRLLSLPPLPSLTGLVAVAGALCEDPPPGGDGDAHAEPGEDLGVVVTVRNTGPDPMSGLLGTLLSEDPYVLVSSPRAHFADVAPDSTTKNDGRPFLVSISPLAPPDHVARLPLVVEGAAATYTYAETLAVSLTLFEAPTFVPSGPDSYGYYAYDSTDTLWAEAPRFEWIEIAPPGPGTWIADLSDNDDRTRLIFPSFVFRYYGANTHYASICTNGFVALASTSSSPGQNSGIPNPQGPPSMLAPFWDDLNPAAAGDIYVWHDTERRRFVVQFEDVSHANSPDTETFQVVLFDPAHYPSSTGDGLVLFQYRDVSDPSGCTVGIESPLQDDGVQYGLNGSWGRYAAPLADSMAILFTTEPPDTLWVPWLVLLGVDIDDSDDGDGDGALDVGETVSLAVEIGNEGTQGAAGVVLTLSSPDSVIAVSDGASALPDIPVGAATWGTEDPFTLSASGAPPDSAATFWLAIQAAGRTCQRALRFDLAIGRREEGPGGADPTRPFPNPFSADMRMLLTLAEPLHVRVSVHDLAGRLVKTIIDAPRDAGPCEVVWDGTNGAGLGVASGVYFVRIETGGRASALKVVRVR